MLKRGFKSWCEKAALKYRQELGINSKDPLSAIKLAEHLKVRVITPNQVPGLSPDLINTLLGEEQESWSAITVCKKNNYLIVYNSSNSVSRQSNDIMHELSHIIICHDAQMVHSFDAGIFLRQFHKDQEDEADCLAATLLLPKEALFKIHYSNKPVFLAAKEYGVSEILMQMRLNTSGVRKIAARAAHFA
jgi:Zn-dependent peptidase ImmA (M78 family)